MAIKLGISMNLVEIGILEKGFMAIGKEYEVPLKRCAKITRDSIAENFRVGGRPRWKPWSPATIRIRRERGIRGSDILVESGAMKSAAVGHDMPERITKQYFAIYMPESLNPRAAVHQDGRSTPFFGRGMVHIPARPYIQIMDEDVEAFRKVFAEWAIAQINGKTRLSAVRGGF